VITNIKYIVFRHASVTVHMYACVYASMHVCMHMHVAYNYYMQHSIYNTIYCV